MGRREEPAVETDQVAVDIAEARNAVRDPNESEWHEVIIAAGVMISLLTLTMDAAVHMRHVKGQRDKALGNVLDEYHDLSNQHENAGITVYRHNQADAEPEKGTITGTHADTYGFEFAQLKHREIKPGTLSTADDLLDTAETNPRLQTELRAVAAKAAAAWVSQEAQETAQMVHDTAGTKGLLEKADITLGTALGKIAPREGHSLAFLGKVAATARTGVLNALPFGHMAFNFAKKVAGDLAGSVANDRAYMDSVATQLLARRLKVQPEELPDGNVRDIEQSLAGIGAAGPVAIPEGTNLGELGQALVVRIASREWREMYILDSVADPSLRYIKAALGVCAAFDLSEGAGYSTLRGTVAPTPAQ